MQEQKKRKGFFMYLMIDNYDSFVYNLARYLEEVGEKVEFSAKRQNHSEKNRIHSGSRQSGRDHSLSWTEKPCRLWELQRNPAENGGKSSDLGCVSGTSDYRPCFRGLRKEGNTSYAWKGNIDYHRR